MTKSNNMELRKQKVNATFDKLKRTCNDDTQSVVTEILKYKTNFIAKIEEDAVKLIDQVHEVRIEKIKALDVVETQIAEELHTYNISTYDDLKNVQAEACLDTKERIMIDEIELPDIHFRPVHKSIGENILGSIDIEMQNMCFPEEMASLIDNTGRGLDRINNECYIDEKHGLGPNINRQDTYNLEPIQFLKPRYENTSSANNVLPTDPLQIHAREHDVYLQSNVSHQQDTYLEPIQLRSSDGYKCAATNDLSPPQLHDLHDHWLSETCNNDHHQQLDNFQQEKSFQQDDYLKPNHIKRTSVVTMELKSGKVQNSYNNNPVDKTEANENVKKSKKYMEDCYSLEAPIPLPPARRRSPLSFRIINVHLHTLVNMKFIKPKKFALGQHVSRICYFKNQFWCPCFKDRHIEIYNLDGKFAKTLEVPDINGPRSIHPFNDFQLLVAAKNGLFTVDIYNGDVVTRLMTGTFRDVHMNGGVIVALEQTDYAKDKVNIFNSSTLQPVFDKYFVVDNLTIQRVIATNDHVFVSFHTPETASYIAKYNLSGETVGIYGKHGKKQVDHMNCPMLCAADKDGNVLLVDSSNKKVKFLDEAAGFSVLPLKLKKVPMDAGIIDNKIFWLLYFDEQKNVYGIETYSFCY